MNSETLQRAVDRLCGRRPAYHQLLAFFGQLFAFQETMVPSIRLEPEQIQQEVLATKIKDSLPLISPAEFPIDGEAAAALLAHLCQLAQAASAPLAACGTALRTGQFHLQRAVRGLLNEEPALLEAMARSLDQFRELLVFFIYHSIRPCLMVTARRLGAYLLTDDPWERSWCPVCGRPPVLATLDPEGRRSLHCGFCWHAWAGRRMACPYCGSRDSRKLNYLFSEAEKEYRLDVCSGCGKYIKTVDLRHLGHPFYAPLELVATVHLDMLAAEQAFQRGGWSYGAM